jgi:hypothetical protein
MSKMDVATQFFHACEQLEGSEGCAQFVADGASFEAQSEPLAEISTVLDYCDWMKTVGEGPLAGCNYDIVASCFDADSSTALFFAIFRATHSGSGGPVEPTGKSTVSHYVYAITVNDDNKVSRMVKVWNAPWALRELGWS